MEEVQAQELEELVQELEEGYGGEEPLSPEVEKLLDALQTAKEHIARRDAATKLGNVETSSRWIVQALMTAYESDSYFAVNNAAARSLRTPVHQEYLRQHPDLMEEAERALRQPASSGSRVPSAGSEAERILVQIEGETSGHEWRTARLALEPVAGTIMISGYRAGVPRISIPASELASCEIVVKEECRDRDQGVPDPGEYLVVLLLIGFIALIKHAAVKAAQVPAIKLTQSMSDGARQQRAIHLRSTETGDRGQAATAEMARRIATFLCQSGYPGVIPDELSEPASFEALVRAKRRGGLLLAVIALSVLAGLVVGLVIGNGQGEQAQSQGVILACGVGFLMALAVGAVVGAVVGAAVTWRNDRIAGTVTGAISATVAASLSWLPVAVWRFVETSGFLLGW